MSDEKRVFCDIDDLGCAQFSEFGMVVRARVSSISFLVWVEFQACIEQKDAFAVIGMRGERFQGFCEDL